MLRMRKRTYARVMSALLAVAIIATMLSTGVLHAFAQNSEYEYTITVQNENFEAINQATVNYEITVDQESLEPEIKSSTQTDENGNVIIDLSTYSDVISNEAPAKLVYEVVKDGFETSQGEAEITLSAEDSELVVTLQSIPQPEPQPQVNTVNVNVNGGNATVILNEVETTQAEVTEGEELNFEIVPEENAYISALKIGDEDVSDLPEKGEAYSGTVVPESDLDITVTITRRYNVTLNVNHAEGGTIKVNNDNVASPANWSLLVDEGDTISYEVTANDGFVISSVTGAVVEDNKSVAVDALKINQDSVITIDFSKVYTVTVECNENGTITITDPVTDGGQVTVTEGTSVTVNAKPNGGYRVSKVKINDENVTIEVENNGGYSKPLNVDKDYTIVVEFEPNVYKITSKVDGGAGTVTLGSETAAHGSAATATITPNEGYYVSAISVTSNGEEKQFTSSEGSNNSIKIENITADTVVNVTFTKIKSISRDEISISTTDLVRNDDNTYVYKNGSTVYLSIAPNSYTNVRYTYKYEGKRAETKWVAAGENCIKLEETADITNILLYKKGEQFWEDEWFEVSGLDKNPLKIVIDKSQPSVKLTTMTEPNNQYYNSDFSFTVNAKDPETYSGISTIGYVVADATTTTEAASSLSYTPIYNFGAQGHQKEVTIENVTVNAANYNGTNLKLFVKATDCAGNESICESAVFHVNTVAPTLNSITISKSEQKIGAADNYYTLRTATVQITDRSDSFDESLVKFTNGKHELEADIDWSSDGDTHTATVTFNKDGEYNWKVLYTNKAGLAMQNSANYQEPEPSVFDFVIDKKAPIDLKISYEPNFIETIIENVTFGFYKADVKVTIEATDETSGIDYLEYSYKLDDNVSLVNVGKEDVVVKNENTTKSAGTMETSFTIPAQFRGKVSFIATDVAGNSIELSDKKTVVIDDIAPGVTVKYTNDDVRNGMYYNANRTATITIDEANFFGTSGWGFADLNTKVPGTEENYLHITVDNGSPELEVKQPEFEAVEDEDNTYKADIPFEEEGEYTLDVKYTDHSGNVFDSYEPELFIIDKTAPVINVKFENNNVRKDNCFKEDRSATISIEEHNFDPTAVELVIKHNGNTVTTYADDLKNIDNWTKKGDVYTFKNDIVFEEDGHYTFGVSCEDLAGNSNEGVDYGTSKAPTEFIIGKSFPTNLTITYEPNFVETIIENVTFGFYQASVKVTIEATDTVSGIDYLEYSYKLEDNVSSDNKGKENVKVINENTTKSKETMIAEFTISPQFRGTVSFSATNNAGRTTKCEHGAIIVVDDVAPGVTVEYKNTDVRNGKYYNANRTATITIDEANFFGTSDWGFADLNTNVPDTEENYLHITVDKVLNDGTIIPEVKQPEFKAVKGEEDTYEASIPFNEDADYTFDIKYTDRSGNVFDSYEPAVFTVDKTAPVVNVTFKNNDVRNDNCFNAGRSATISIVEHNFDPTEVALKIKHNDNDLTTYDEELKNIDNWTKQGDVYTFKKDIVFEDDGHYTFGISCEDLAGNSNSGVNYNDSAAPEEFIVDKTDPVDLKISYEPNFVETIIENITFGFYQASVTVTIEATDETSGIDYLEYSYKLDDKVSSINNGQEGVVVENENTTKSNETKIAEFKIPAHFRGKVSFVAYDNAGNHKTESDGRTVVVDDLPPGVTVEYKNTDVRNGKYYNANRTAIITVNEANFFGTSDWGFADLNTKVPGTDENYLHITVDKVLNDGTIIPEVKQPEFKAVKGEEDTYEVSIPFNEDADYTFDIKYTDRSGNVFDSYEPDVFVVDKIAPVINVEFGNNDVRNEKYFNAGRTATISIEEHNFDPEAVELSIQYKDSETSEYSKITTYDKEIAKRNNWTQDGDVYTFNKDIVFENEGFYTFDISCEDLAENSNKGVNYGDSISPTEFVVDTTAPTELVIKIDDNDDNDVNLVSQDIVFNTFYSKTVTVKLEADGDISGLKSLKYKKVDSPLSDPEKDENSVWVEYDSEGIKVQPSDKFIIYFRAEDNAGNVSIVHSTGIVVDNKKPGGEQYAPEIDITPEEPNKNGFYNDNVSVDIKVVDPRYKNSFKDDNGYFSGLSKITYKIYAKDIEPVEEVVVLNINPNTEAGESLVGTEVEGVVTEVVDGLIESWAKTIEINAETFNSNNVIVEVTAIDNAGNSHTTYTLAGDIRIDKTQPQINVSYDNNNGDTSFAESTYFKTDRTAKIVITERNFDAKDVEIKITNTDEVIPVISNWNTVPAAEGNGDATTHTATITYSADGDYTFDIKCVDRADNGNLPVDYGKSLAPKKFTIDKTLPTVSVTYDNNDALNENYYKADRVATIVVNEHNFETSRVNIKLNATDNGVRSVFPVVSGWSSNGNLHTATITYSADSLYTFDFEYNDKAGNATANIDEQVFYIDKTNPSLSITGVVDQSANTGDGNIGFVISANDTNFDVFTPVITAVVKTEVGYASREVNIGSISEVPNGMIYTVNNIETDGIYRINCTVVDKAGNAYSEVVLARADGSNYVEQRSGDDTLLTFSVNRSGSAYEIGGSTAKLLEQYYVQNVEDDVVIVEVNVDPLTEYIVTLNGKELALHTDYSVTQEGGSGNWTRYIYTIKKELFSDEGEYKLVVSSKDKAENNAFSDVKGGNVNFVVDRTAPVVTVSGLATNGRYQTDSQKVVLIPTDDGGALNSIIVRMVDENGKVLEELINLAGDALTEALEANGGKIEFEIAEGLYQNVQIICNDCAIDAEGKTNTYDETFTNVSVSSSGIMIFWANKPLRWGSIVGVVLLTAGIIFFVIYKKKKQNEK